jgi:hypothetical protein
MDEFRSLAFMSVGRAVMFSFLGIALLTLCFSSAPVLALNIGGSSALLLTFVLAHRSFAMLRRDATYPDIWAMLVAGRQPRNGDSRREIAEILSLTYLAFARWTSGAASLFFAGALLTSLLQATRAGF